MIYNFNKDLRPISLTSTLSKVAEGIVIEKELKPVIFSSIDPGQFGFIPGSSTTHIDAPPLAARCGRQWLNRKNCSPWL